ncbi:hypothetical protein [Alteromonas sp. a30]|uniref:hypothetical protein n=1 Tax=Alteromonas sp. a30 TaxID=2730917 RepID=UPI002280A305|nr:hypothetical protein [Alteromonas sp. a30]MCY7294107.1 hypothetical protein [Alteromonas sp. a30]
MKNKRLRYATIGALSFTTLVNCGGGGSASTPLAPPSNPVPPVNSSAPLSERLTLITPEQVETNQSVGLVATVTAGAEITRSNWIQTAGPNVQFLAKNSQVIGFDVIQSGDYRFTYQGTDANGDTSEKEVSFSVSESDASAKAMVRLDHAVTEQGKVSLRVDSSDANNANAQISWRQISGPTISQDQLTVHGHFLFFDAPAVTRDTLLEFEARLRFSDGSEDTDNAFVLVKNTDINGGGFFPDASSRIVSEDVYTYQPQSPYANVLVNCVYNNQIDTSCPFSTLPLIGGDSPNPDIDDIMQRVVVSHDWMAERFREYLETSPVSNDIIGLLKAVTAIVISVDVRPSFYWAATGAIYLDAANFWVTPEERDTLNDVPDFRSAFGNELRFIMPWRYAENGEDYLNRNDYSRILRETRSQEDVQADITWLLFHELAHANDFFDPAVHQSLPGNISPLLYANQNGTSSEQLVQALPLSSNQMKGLAQVSFAGETATSTQRRYDAADIENAFRPDGAVMYYSYFTSREDFATLFERFMMSYRLGVDSDVAVISREDNPDFLVQWGQRNRFNSPQVRQRTQFVVNSIYPNLNVTAALNTLPAPQDMIRGVSWFDNLMNSTDQSNTSAHRHTHTEAELHMNERELHWNRPVLPKVQ